MNVRVRLPPLLRSMVGGADWVSTEGATVADALGHLAKSHAPLARHLFDDTGHIRPGIVFLHDGELVRAKDAAERALRDEDEIVVTNALSGG